MFLKNDPEKLQVFVNFKQMNRDLTKAYLRQQNMLRKMHPQTSNQKNDNNSASQKQTSIAPRKQQVNLFLDDKEKKQVKQDEITFNTVANIFGRMRRGDQNTFKYRSSKSTNYINTVSKTLNLDF